MIEAKPNEYICIRVLAVHVQRKYCFLHYWREKELASTVCIPDDSKKALELFDRIREIMKEYGVEVKK